MENNIFYCWSLNKVSRKNKMFCSLNSYKWSVEGKKTIILKYSKPKHSVFESIQSFSLVS